MDEVRQSMDFAQVNLFQSTPVVPDLDHHQHGRLDERRLLAAGELYFGHLQSQVLQVMETTDTSQEAFAARMTAQLTAAATLPWVATVENTPIQCAFTTHPLVNRHGHAIGRFTITFAGTLVVVRPLDDALLAEYPCWYTRTARLVNPEDATIDDTQPLAKTLALGKTLIVVAQHLGSGAIVSAMEIIHKYLIGFIQAKETPHEAS